MKEKLSRQNKMFRKVVQLACLMGSISVLYVGWRIVYFFYGYSFYPSGMILAQYVPKDVIGDLGGMKVVIPRYYSEYVEYDGDPGFGEKLKKPPPVRTFKSRLRSFGVEVRFPDMTGLVNREIRQEKHRQPLREDNWLYVSVSAGGRYYGDESINRLASDVLKPGKYPRYWWNNYVKLPERRHGLEVYMVAGKDPNTGKPARESHYTNDVYLDRRLTGKVDTHIVCRRASVPSGVATCDMSFTLEPKARVEIGVSFRRDLLPEWQKIKTSARCLILGFEVEGKSRSDASAPCVRESN